MEGPALTPTRPGMYEYETAEGRIVVLQVVDLDDQLVVILPELIDVVRLSRFKRGRWLRRVGE